MTVAQKERVSGHEIHNRENMLNEYTLTRGTQCDEVHRIMIPKYIIIIHVWALNEKA